MAAMYTATLVSLIVASVAVLWNVIFRKKSKESPPPGSSGWPVIGETFEFATAAKGGHPENFIFDRMAKYSSLVFKTHLFGAPAAVLCGADGNKFIFTNENKLVQKWHSSSIKKIFPHYMQTSANESGSKLRKMLPIAVKADALRRHVGIMDQITRTHFVEHWDTKKEIVVHPLLKEYTLWVACRLFLSMEDGANMTRFGNSFDVLIAGLYSIPIDLPGTTLNRALESSKMIKEQLYFIIHRRKIELAEGKVTPDQDVLSHMLSMVDQNGKSEDEMNIADMILGLLIGGHDTATSACTSVVKYLAEYPDVYEGVYQEQTGIANSKEEGELLSWEDMQKMKYSWKVACEVMRLAPPASGGFREAKTDFNFKGYNIPKGWKLYWSIVSTHKNPDFFPEPEKFDPSRFDGKGPAPYTFIPFGAGPRMCPGSEYARMLILVFMHNLVTRFRWEKMIPDEKTVLNPLPVPVSGLPIRLHPHSA